MQRRSLFTATTAAALAAALPACGFKLRGVGSTQYVFQSIFSGFIPSSTLGQDFKRTATSWGLKVLDLAQDADKAQVVLRVHSEQREKVVVGSGVAGQVREFQLRLRLKFSLFNQTGKLLLDEVELLQQRDVSYTESAALAKEAEEQLLYRDMQLEIVLQLMRRLAAVKDI
jgi:LPS-assembly lipoprotein